MTLRNTRPLRFTPTGLSDSLDETDEFPGACAVLQDLIPDQTTKGVWTCRPASTKQTDFASIAGAGYVSVFRTIGSYVYGLIASSIYAGKDQPFCFNLATGVFITVSGITATNVPASPLTSGDWVPPTMDLVGVNLVVTHPGFDGTTHYFGWFDITFPAAPVWHAGNLNATGAVVALGAITAGSLYTNGVYAGVALTGGTGTGATADITVSGGAVTGVALRDAGKNYIVGDSLSATTASIGGTGSGFHVAVAAITTAGLIQFTTRPAWVSQFNGRAYFGINPPNGQPSVVFTDPLTLGCTNANQALTFGDNQPLVAAGGLPLTNQLGGVVQSLMVFKNASVYQITGDAAFSNLSVNALQVSTGTYAPRSLCSTPSGLAFLAPDGLRIIDLDARVGKPIGIDGTGINLPFISPLYPSRAAAASNASVLRISIQNTNIAAPSFQEYWYDLVREIWSGPHSFPANCYDTYQNAFVITPTGVDAALFVSPTVQGPTSGFIENGNQMVWSLQTVMLADNLEMAQSELTELQVKIAQGTTQSFNAVAQDQDGNPYGVSTYTFSGGVGSLWGSMVWGTDPWGGQGSALYPRRISFDAPIVYNRLAINYNGQSQPGFKIGDTFIRRRTLGYIQEFA